MKRIYLAAAAAFTVLAFGSAAMAQTTASASVTVITPVAVTKTTDLAFGSITSAATSGTVVVAATAGGTRSITGGVALVGTSGTAASFAVTADGSTAYTITVPATFAVGTMTATTATSTLPTSGASTSFYVGASLAVPASTAPGTYNGSFNVTAAYN